MKEDDLMNTVGLMIPTKEHEHRRVLRPCDIASMKHKEQLYLCHGYGEICGFSDEDYRASGAHIDDPKEVMRKQIICDPKIGDASYLQDLADGTILFGWVHPAETKERAELLMRKKMNAFAWENMYEEGRAAFYKNSELAGKAAVLHAFQLYGTLPQGKKVAILGNGNTAKGAMQILYQLGAYVDVYPRKAEQAFLHHFQEYDVIINCILWDVERSDHILYLSDLKKMKPHAMIIDVSCDAHCAIESSQPTTFTHPVYEIDGILHYAVDHTPSLFHRSFLEDCGPICAHYLDILIADGNDPVLQEANILKDGVFTNNDIFVYLQMLENNNILFKNKMAEND